MTNEEIFHRAIENAGGDITYVQYHIAKELYKIIMYAMHDARMEGYTQGLQLKDNPEKTNVYYDKIMNPNANPDNNTQPNNS